MFYIKLNDIEQRTAFNDMKAQGVFNGIPSLCITAYESCRNEVWSFDGKDIFTYTRESERLRLPMFYNMTEEEQQTVIHHIRHFLLDMSLAKASIWTAGSTLIKIGAGLLVVKLLAVSFGPSEWDLRNFRQLITVLGVLSGAVFFNGVTN